VKRLLFRSLLGSAVPGEEKITPLGIRYQASGFDQPCRDRIQESIEWLKTQGIDPSNFETYALKLTEDSKALPLWIDVSYMYSRGKWEACGGVWAWTVKTYKPSAFLITLTDEPIKDGESFRLALSKCPKLRYEALRRRSNTTNAEISVVACGMEDGRLNPIDNLLQWEWGNLFDLAMGTYRLRRKVEIGNHSPCAPIPQKLGFQ